jgi:alcohol oxidase
VSYGGAYTNVGKQFLDVAAAYDKERSHTNDPNALFSCNEYGVRPCSVFLLSAMKAEIH